MSKKPIILITLLLLFISLVLGITLPATANPPSQAFYFTPTADDQGRIIYTVKSGDSCNSISLLNGITQDEIRRLNNLDASCVLQPDQKLILKLVTGKTPTTELTTTPTSMLPSPTPVKGFAAVCVDLFEDLNGNALADVNEISLAGGAISISDAFAKFSHTGVTKGDNVPICIKNGKELESASCTADIISEDAVGTSNVCFLDVPEGEYTISIAVPEGYNATTKSSYLLKVKAGDQVMLNFGAQKSAQTVIEKPTPEVTKNPASPILAIAGGVILLVGLWLGIYAWILNRRKEPF